MLEVLSLRHIRCFAEKKIHGAPFMVIVGSNGQGKTTILESLSLLAFGKSFRTSAINTLVAMDLPAEESSAIDAIFSEDMRLRYYIHHNKSALWHNENRITSAKRLMSYFRLIIMADDATNIMRGYPQERRSLVDQAVTYIYGDDGYEYLSRYRKIASQKQSLLLHEPDYATYCSWHEQLTAANDVLVNKRREILTGLQCIINDMPLHEYGFGALSYDYRLPADMGLESLALKQLFNKERSAKRVLWGAHLHDISFAWGGLSMREYGSRAQQKIALLLLKIALYKKSLAVFPAIEHILAIDDIAADLDPLRQECVIRMLASLPGQKIVTLPYITDQMASAFSAYNAQILILPD